VRRRLDDTGLVALDIEPVILGPDGDPGDRLIDVAAEIGARHVLVASRWDDPVVVTERFAALCDRAAPHDITVVLEFLPIFGIRTLTEAVAIVIEAARPNGGVLVDTLHLARSGGSPADLVTVDPALLPYLQVADAPATVPVDLASLVDEARYGRLLAGDGVLPIREVTEAVPSVPLSFELRSRALHQTYPDPEDRAMAVMQNWLEFSSGAGSGADGS
jgi:sugar phosphate isomerase/epimerase